MDDETLDLVAVAAYLKSDEQTVANYARTGKLAGARLGKRKCWVFLKEDVVAFLRERIATETAARRNKEPAPTYEEDESVVLPGETPPEAAPTASPPAATASGPKGKTVYPPLEQLTQSHVDTEWAAFYFGRKPQTLRSWATYENGLMRPIRLNGRLAWSVEEIAHILEVKLPARARGKS